MQCINFILNLLFFCDFQQWNSPVSSGWRIAFCTLRMKLLKAGSVYNMGINLILADILQAVV